MYIKKKTINNLITLRGEKILPLSKKTGINRGNLSLWLKDIKGGYLSKEKVHTLSQALGYDYQDGKLLKGIHRWPASWKDGKLLVETLNSLSPSGGMLIPVIICIDPPDFFTVENEDGSTDNYGGNGHYQIHLIAIPNDLSFRVILGTSQNVFSRDFLETFFPELEKTKSSWKTHLVEFEYDRRRIIDRLDNDSISIPELDKIIGINDLEWTWERLVSVLKEQGKVPVEVAFELGLVERENKSKRETPSRKKMPLLSRSTEGESIAAEDEPQ